MAEMVDINFKVKTQNNVEPISNSSFLESLVNVQMNDMGDPIKRPGSTPVFTLCALKSVDDLFWWDEPQFLVAYSNGYIYRVLFNGDAKQLSMPVQTGTSLSFASFRGLTVGNFLYACSRSGSRILQWDSSGTSAAYITDGDAPTDAIEVALFKDYLIALRKDSQRITWAQPGVPTDWPNPIEWVEAASQPDNVIAIRTGADELILFGKTSIDYMYATGDSTSAFEPIPGSSLDVGCLGPQFILRYGNGYIFLTDQRKLVYLQERRLTTLSTEWDRQFQDMTNVGNAKAYPIFSNGNAYFAFYVPDEAKTYVYDMTRQYWSQWKYSQGGSPDYNYFGKCGVYSPVWNLTFVGSRLSDGVIHVVDQGYYLDNADIIQSEIRTGWLNFGVDARKTCTRALFKLKRGDGTSPGRTASKFGGGTGLPGGTNNAGITWVGQSGAAAQQWRGLAYGNCTFVAVAIATATNNVMYSTDGGVTWTYATAGSFYWRAVTFGDGLFVAVASQFIATSSAYFISTSPDGVFWTTRLAPATNAWFGVTYGNGLFVAVATTGTGNRVMTSSDGITWTIRVSATDYEWYDVTYGNGLFVAVAATSGTNDSVMTSPDGITWTLRTVPVQQLWTSVTFGNGLFVAVATNGSGQRFMSSPDGITWTMRTSTADIAWTSVTFGNNLFVAVATGGTSNGIATSPDGITWTVRIPPSDISWTAVAFGNRRFAAVATVGSDARVMTSVNT